MKSVLIFGGNRFVGLELAKTLSSNYKVTVFNRKGTGPDSVNIIKGDRNNEEDLNKISFDSFNYIFDFCLFKPEQFKLIKNKINPKTKYVFISSAAVYKNKFNLAYDEKDNIGGRNEFHPYGAEKSECEILIQNTHLDYIIFRPPYIDGPGSHRPRVAYYFNQLKNNLPISRDGDGNACISIVWVDDFVNLLKYSIDSNFSVIDYKVNNIVGKDIYTINSLINELAVYLNTEPIFIDDKNNAPYPNTNLILANNDLTTYFKPLVSKLDNFKIWFDTNSKQYYGY